MSKRFSNSEPRSISSGPKTVDIVKDVNIVLVDYLVVNRKVDIIIISLLKIRVTRAETSDVLLWKNFTVMFVLSYLLSNCSLYFDTNSEY